MVVARHRVGGPWLTPPPSGTCASEAGFRSSIYQLHAHDFAWLSEAWALHTEKPDDGTMTRLEEITSATHSTRRLWPR
jgi:hypothetical protein